uniref:Uncharacterized protein n=1 Tax=Oryza brachyantha TaxID=4533 RepID=J3N3Z4_ORYBR
MVTYPCAMLFNPPHRPPYWIVLICSVPLSPSSSALILGISVLLSLKSFSAFLCTPSRISPSRNSQGIRLFIAAVRSRSDGVAAHLWITTTRVNCGRVDLTGINIKRVRIPRGSHPMCGACSAGGPRLHATNLALSLSYLNYTPFL